jgi:two-component system, NtrC family, sensor kinase
MKLALKIAIAVTIVIAIVLGLDGVFRVQRQLETFEKDTRRDHLSMGRATAAAITASWVSYGETLAMDLIRQISKKTSRVSVRWIPLDMLRNDPLPLGLNSEDQSRIFNGQSVSNIKQDNLEGKRMVTYVPIAPDNKLVGAIEIIESLANQSKHIHSTVLRTTAITITTILICAAATLLLGVYLIGRPIRKLVQQAVRIGKGDFGISTTFNQNDEISELSMEMNTMASRLARAIKRIESETRAHLQTLEQLRHADRLKTVGQLTSSVVHEVGTPLTVIVGRAKMIQSAEAEGEEAKECARIVVEQAEKVTKTVREILDFARVSPQERRSQDISLIVRQMVHLLNPVAVKAGIYLNCDGVTAPAVSRVDANQIQQVLANLIINAIQSGRAGGHVSVGIEAVKQAPPDGDSQEPISVWAVSVQDDGCGIPEESIARIFESFYTTKTSGNGTGLGLAISREIVHEHGGWMIVESAVDKGSTFTVCLPIDKGNT